jgi:hypothetical protein
VTGQETGLREGLDPLRFLRARLGFQPDDKQTGLLQRRGKRVLLNCSRQWGKSTLAAAMAVHRAYFRPGSLTLVLAPTTRQSGELVRKAAGFMARLGFKRRGDGDNELSLLFPNGSRVVGLPGTEATVRGFSAVSLVVIDEAARVRDELYLSVRPMMAAAGGDMWLMSTPFGKRGFFWEAWSGGGPEWERVMAPATECPRIPAEFLEEERHTLGPRWFRQEYLCEFNETDERVFSEEVIQRAFTDEIPPLEL